MDAETMRRLRAALVRGDGMSVVAVLEGRVPHELLQLAGDGLLLALGQGVPGAAELVHTCVPALRERGWAGDDELAAELEAATSALARPLTLKGVPIDLDELSMVLEAGPEDRGGVIDLISGEVWSKEAVEQAKQVSDNAPDLRDENRWLPVEPEGSRERYLDMADFAATVHDPAERDQLLGTIDDEPDAFHRFKDRMADWPQEQQRWVEFLEERYRGRARWWLAEAGYRSVPRATPSPA
ncbi:MAG TPA: UPF0158 family protein [Acidimicrobiales bacterium]|nr:UPF0158 family protein [Acidimicrobiales bacterium]